MHCQQASHTSHTRCSEVASNLMCNSALMCDHPEVIGDAFHGSITQADIARHHNIDRKAAPEFLLQQLVQSPKTKRCRDNIPATRFRFVAWSALLFILVFSRTPQAHQSDSYAIIVQTTTSVPASPHHFRLPSQVPCMLNSSKHRRGSLSTNLRTVYN